MNSKNLSQNNPDTQNATDDVLDFAKALCTHPQQPPIDPFWDNAVFSLAYVLSDYTKATSETGELRKDSVLNLLKEVYGQNGDNMRENLSTKFSGFYEERSDSRGAKEFNCLMICPATPTGRSVFRTLQSVALDLLTRLSE